MKLLEAWHLCSLDAPTVAVVWTLYLARTLGRPLPWALAPAMFLATWILYAGDRLLDARTENAPLEARHHFHRCHRGVFRALIVLAAVALIPLIATFPRDLLLRYAALGMLLAGWLLAVHWTRTKLPKELAAGVFFAVAVALPTHAGWVTAALLAGMVTLNGMYIDAWESGLAVRWLGLATGLLGVAGSVLAPHALNLPVAVAAGLLFLLGTRVRRRVRATTLRALADAALLTPLLFWWVRR